MFTASIGIRARLPSVLNREVISGLFLKDWETKLKEFLVFNERAVLSNVGSIRKNDADAREEAEYERFAERRRIPPASRGPVAEGREVHESIESQCQ